MRMLFRLAGVLCAPIVLCVACAGCTGPAVRPADLSKLYDRSAPLLAVNVDDSVVLAKRESGPAIAVRVVYPTGPGPWPLIVFSHGMFSSNRAYMPILEYWVARGFVVVAPNHIDANGGFAPKRNEDVEAPPISAP